MRRARIATAITGAAMLAVAGAGAASAHATSRTLHFTAVQTADVMAGNIDIATEKDLLNGKVIGYDVNRCAISPPSHTGTCDIAVSREGGFLYAHISVSLLSGKGTGVVTGGTGEFRNAHGTVTGVMGGQNTTYVTIKLR